MKKMAKKIAVAVCAAAMTLSSALSVSAAAKQPYPFYEPSNNEFVVINLYTKYDCPSGIMSCTSKFTVQYKRATDSYNIISYTNEGCGDINNDGKITMADVVMIRDIAMCNLTGKKAYEYYTDWQLFRAQITTPGGDGTISMVDAQILQAYVQSGTKKSVEQFILSNANYKQHVKIDSLYWLSWQKKAVVVNVNCPNSYRQYYA